MSAAGFEETELSYAAEDKEDDDDDYNDEGKLFFDQTMGPFLGEELQYESVCP